MNAKQQAAEAAVPLVRSGMKLGLGTGSTIQFFLEALGREIASGRLRDLVGIPTSERTAAVARSVGIPVVTFAEVPELDLAVDGADEVDPDLNLTKGQGGALLREKIVARVARRFVVVADASKAVDRLGSAAPLAVEILPFAAPLAVRGIEALGAQVRVRDAYQTDNGNLLADCTFAPIADPAALARQLEAIPGVVDHGLFLDMAHDVFLADGQVIAHRSR